MARGTIYIDASLKDDAGNVLVAGRMLLGMNDVINPRDLGLSTIKAITFSAWDTLPTTITPGSAGSMVGQDYNRSAPRYVTVVSGSIGSLNSLGTGVSPGTQGGNYVRFRAMRIRAGATGTGPRVVTQIGTHPGSTRVSYFAVGR